MIEEAAAFAAQAHHGTFRKGTQIPYITHPMEAALIVSGFTDDPEMIAAALLHDVVEVKELISKPNIKYKTDFTFFILSDFTYN